MPDHPPQDLPVPSAPTPDSRPSGAATARQARQRRSQLASVTVVLTGIGLAAGLLADLWLPADGGSDWGVLQLRLLYNPGVAFGLGDTLPAWLITVATALITAGIAVYAWVVAARTTAIGRIGLAAVVAGATANLIDRAVDGYVTDYLHTGWFPTFNLPDVFITVGAALVALAVLTEPAMPHPARTPERTRLDHP